MTNCSICGSDNTYEHTFVYYCLDCEERDGYETAQPYDEPEYEDELLGYYADEIPLDDYEDDV